MKLSYAPMSIRSPSRLPDNLVWVRNTSDSCPGHQENADCLFSKARNAAQPFIPLALAPASSAAVGFVLA
eukprot:9526874-Prorocentrum_lima.AAC.1